MALQDSDLPKLIELLNQIDIRVKQRRKTAAAWVASDEILLAGEWGFEPDTGRAKIGDGVSGWNARPYYGFGVRPLTDAPNIALDAKLGDNWRVTLGGNRTLDNPTNLIDAQVLNIRIIQDATGGRTLAYGSQIRFPGGVVPVLSTAAGAVDFMSCQYDAVDGNLLCVLNRAFG